jgi:hypothetical protein
MKGGVVVEKIAEFVESWVKLLFGVILYGAIMVLAWNLIQYFKGV